MEQQISQISLSSKRGSGLGSRHKQLATTKNDSKLLELDSCYSGYSQDQVSSFKSERIREIQRKIALIESGRNQLENKFSKVIQNLTRQIVKKDEMNVQLQQEIDELKNYLKESKNDVSIITNYLRKKQMVQPESGVRQTVLNSTKNSGKLEKSISNSKGSIDLSSKDIKIERKNRSPRQLLLKKSFKE